MLKNLISMMAVKQQILKWRTFCSSVTQRIFTVSWVLRMVFPCVPAVKQIFPFDYGKQGKLDITV